MWQGWINGVIGLWLILSGIVGGLHAQWNYIVTGIILAVFGFWAYKAWQGIVTGILGLWLLFSGIFVTVLVSPANMIIVGIVAAVLSFWESYSFAPQTTQPHGV